MAPFRPSNLNKRSYPGNASVIGPTKNATVGFTTTTCCTCISTICGSTTETFTLGCRCSEFQCPYCLCCCCCKCTVCDRTVPSGMWKSSEQYTAKKADSWGDDSCSNDPAIGFCSPCCGVLSSVGNDCKGFFICCGPSTNKWFVAPSCTEVSRNWYCRADAVIVSNSLMGSCGWFIPSYGQLLSPMYNCRTYWDSYCLAGYHSDTEAGTPCSAWYVNMSNGTLATSYVTNPQFTTGKYLIYCARAFRCTVT